MKFSGYFNPNKIISENSHAWSQSITFSGMSHFKQDGTDVYWAGNCYNLELICTDEIISNKAESAFKIINKNGIDGIKLLDGEFLIIISTAEKYTVIRDRHGAGLQFFYNETQFCSDLNLFLEDKSFVAKPNIKALYSFLNRGYIPAPLTALNGVKKLEAGCMLEVTGNDQKIINLFDFNDFSSFAGSLHLSDEDATSQYEYLHKQAILQRMKGVTSSGVLLSGGYDSGGNISALRDLYNGPIYSYSIGFKDDPWTELPLAKILSKRYQTTHFEYEIDGSEINFLPEIILKTGDPFQESGLMVNHSVMRMVAKSETYPSIILGGDGNDQHFGTFGKEMAMNWRINKASLQPFQKLYEKVGHLSVFDNDNILFRTQFHNQKILNILEPDTFGFLPHQLNKLLRTEYRTESVTFQKPGKINSFDDFFTFRNYFVDIQQTVNEVILFKASKMASLYNNLLTFPYMSTDLYNWLKLLPREQKFKGSVLELSKGQGVSKYLHKNYLKSKLPVEITQRKKQGGFAPLPLFFKDKKQREKIIRFIRQSDAVRALFITEKIDEFLDQYEQLATTSAYWFWQRQVKAFQLFNLLVLCTWWELFINRRQFSTLNELID